MKLMKSLNNLDIIPLPPLEFCLSANSLSFFVFMYASVGLHFFYFMVLLVRQEFCNILLTYFVL